MCRYEWNDFTEEVEAFNIVLLPPQNKKKCFLILSDGLISFYEEDWKEILDVWFTLEENPQTKLRKDSR
jgi:hypothetical protein